MAKKAGKKRKKQTTAQKKRTVKSKTPKIKVDRPFSNVDEEIHNVNKKILSYSKKIGMPRTDHKVSWEIDQEMSRFHKLVHAGLKIKTYAATYTVALAILALLMGTPQSFIIQWIFGLVLLWIGHRLHIRSHKYDLTLKVAYMGIMIIPLYIMYTNLDDLMSLVMVLLYMVSFIVAIALYFHHTSKEVKRELHQSFTRTFLVSWYSHVMALAVAVLVAYYLPFLLFGNSFVSVLYVMLAWMIPPFFVYFYLNKFLYLRFFDPVHIRHDSKKALKHGLAYTGIFVVSLLLIYLLTAVQVVLVEKTTSTEIIDESINELRSIRTQLFEVAEAEYSNEINEMQVTKDLLRYSEELINSFESRKAVVTEPFSVMDYFNDRWFHITSQKRLALTFLQLNKNDAMETTQDIIRNYKKIPGFNSTQIADTREFVESDYEPYSETEDLKEFREYVYENRENYAYLVINNDLYAFASSQSASSGINVFAPGKSTFAQQVHLATSHLRIFRDALIFAFEDILYSSRNFVSPEIIDKLYFNRYVDETELSKAVRYKILEENYKAVPGRG